MSSMAVLAVSTTLRLAQCDQRDSRSRPWVTIQFPPRTKRLFRFAYRRCGCKIRRPRVEIARCAPIHQSIRTNSSASGSLSVPQEFASGTRSSCRIFDDLPSIVFAAILIRSLDLDGCSSLVHRKCQPMSGNNSAPNQNS